MSSDFDFAVAEKVARNIVNRVILFALEKYERILIEHKEEEEEEEEEEDEREENDKDDSSTWGLLEAGVEYQDAAALELAGENKYDREFCYNYTKLYSKPQTTNQNIIKSNLLTLHATYGYACQKLYNLIALDSSVLAFLAGNYVVFYNFKKQRKKYFRSLGGTGLSTIAVGSEKNYFVVGEIGNRPTINVFKYPSFVLLRILQNGTEKQYSHLDFNSDSSLLASLGGEPDYTLAIWDWRRETITWRSRAFSQDVFKVSFSTEFPDKLITSGLGHIKFWTMADTFTGCKLQGVLGKFGHVELSDIRGFSEISGDRTISGSEWGNILLWEDGMCVAEIMRKGKNCHDGSIEHIVNDNGSVLTIGLDGVIKVWDIEERMADRSSQLFKWEMDPLDEIKIGKRSELTYVVKVDKSSAADSGVWLAQDRNGAIWMIDLSFQLNSFEPRSLMSCHAGAVNACVSSPISELFATAGADCTIRVYDYVIESQLLVARYNSSVTSIIWLPTSVDPSGGSLVAGFGDGVVRMLRFQKKSHNDTTNQEMGLCDVIKPHNDSVTRLCFNPDINLLASGSKDKTVFFFTLSGFKLDRIGFVQTEFPVTNLSWAPPFSGKELLLVSCECGKVLEFDVSGILTFDNSLSYHLSDLPVKEFQFRSRKITAVKSEVVVPQTSTVDDAEECEEEEEEEMPESITESDEVVVSLVSLEKVLFAIYDHDMSFWISVDGPSGGFLHECGFDAMSDQNMLNSVRLAPALGTPVRCYTIHTINDLIMFGAGNGTVMAYEFSGKNLEMLDQHYWLSVLDSKGAEIADLCLSYDESHLFVVGTDGNIFSFMVKSWDASRDTLASDYHSKASTPSHKDLPDVEDITDSTAASLEDSMTLKRLREAKAKAEESKKLRLETLKKMQKVFKELSQNNQKLPSQLRLFKEEFLIDSVFEKEARKKREEMLDTTKRQLLFEYIKADMTLKKVQARYTGQEECGMIEVKALTSNLTVSSYRLPALPEGIVSGRDISLDSGTSKSTYYESECRSRAMGASYSPEAYDETNETIGRSNENLYKKLRKMGNHGIRKIKMFEKVEAQRFTREKRKREWDLFLLREPKALEKIDTEDFIIREAQHNLGDMKLKSAVGSKVILEKQRLTLEKSSKALSNHIVQQHQLMKCFNTLLLKLREAKKQVVNNWFNCSKRLEELKAIVPDLQTKLLPICAEMTTNEYPERKFKMKYSVTKDKVEFLVAADKSPQKAHQAPKNDMEEMIKTREKILYRHESDVLLNKVRDEVRNFEARLAFLRTIKFSLDVYVKQGEMREMLLLQEKMKMFEMKKEEEVLISKLNSKLKDEMEHEKKIDDLNQKLEKCNKDLSKLTAQQNQMEKTFLSTIPENYKFTDFLVKVYKQKVRRKAQTDYKSGIDEEDEDDLDDDLDEEEYDDDEDNFDEDDDNYMNLDVCPEGCNIALYEKTTQLRELRMDITEKITENKKIKETSLKDLEVKKKFAKSAIEEAAKATLNLDLYQVAKLKAVNEFFGVVLVTLRQIEFMDEDNEGLIFDSLDMLVVDLHQIKFLEKRIQQLESENQQHLKSIKETQEKHLFLTQSKARMTERISIADEEVKQAMKRKFGKMINLERIESVLVSPAIEELMYDFDQVKLKHQREMANLKRLIDQTELRLSQEVKLNTDIINYTLAYKDVAQELAEDLSRKQEDMVAKRQPNPVNLKETISLVQKQVLDIIRLKKKKYRLFYYPSLIKRF